jgi:hypothetical protein
LSLGGRPDDAAQTESATKEVLAIMKEFPRQVSALLIKEENQITFRVQLNVCPGLIWKQLVEKRFPGIHEFLRPVLQSSLGDRRLEYLPDTVGGLYGYICAIFLRGISPECRFSLITV